MERHGGGAKDEEAGDEDLKDMLVCVWWRVGPCLLSHLGEHSSNCEGVMLTTDLSNDIQGIYKPLFGGAVSEWQW